jgi:hypothetical protein
MQAESQSRVALVVDSVLSFYKRDTCRPSQLGNYPPGPAPWLCMPSPAAHGLFSTVITTRALSTRPTLQFFILSLGGEQRSVAPVLCPA